MITTHGAIPLLSIDLIEAAEMIKEQNHSTDTGEYIKHHISRGCNKELFNHVASISGVDVHTLDAVLFSCIEGAKPHVDKLNLLEFEDTTFIVPVLLPLGSVVLNVGESSSQVDMNHIYEFNHTVIHSLDVEHRTGCVVIMFAISKK